MRKVLIILLLSLCTLSFSKFNNKLRFFSPIYSISIDLPEGFTVKNHNNFVEFVSNFSRTELFFYVHGNFLDLFETTEKTATGKLVAKNKEVDFSHCRMLRASRGGYIIFNNKSHITHYLFLKREYRIYIFKTNIAANDLPKFKAFIAAIRLLMPEETPYEGESKGHLHRMILISDKTFRYSIFKKGNITVYIGFYKYSINNSLKLMSAFKILKKDDGESVRKKSRRIFTMYKYNDDGNIKYGDIIFKQYKMKF